MTRDSAAKLYKAEPMLVAALRELYEQFGIRAMGRALRQLKSERGYLRIKRQLVN